MESIKIGQLVKAKNDRVFEYLDHNPLVIWKKGHTYRVSGVFQNSPGGMLDIMVDLDDGAWENVPQPIFFQEFDLVH